MWCRVRDHAELTWTDTFCLVAIFFKFFKSASSIFNSSYVISYWYTITLCFFASSSFPKYSSGFSKETRSLL